MNYIHQNSYIVPGTPGYRLVENSSETRPAAGEASALSGESGDMIALSYSHGKPSNSSHVMTPVRGTFILPELPEGGTHTVVASGKVDDSVLLTVDDSSASSTSGATHSFSLSIEGLQPGVHKLAVVHHNIDYYPDPTGNISVISGSVGPCPRFEIEPDENVKVDCECGCGCDSNDGDSGGELPAPAARISIPHGSFGSSSAGSGIIREARLQYMRWSATFGTFRGMGGIPKGRIELIGYRYSASLLTPAGLAYSHPAASFVSLPAGGIRPNGLLRVRQGGAYANYICDANGRTAFGVGSTSSSTDRADFVTELVRTPSAALPLAEAAYLRILKTDGTATFYHLETGAFAACISSQNSLLTAEEAAQYLDIVREQNGTIRQIWNYWDGLADIVVAENGYTVSLYLPNQITGQNPASGLYTTSGTPFKTYAIGGDPAASSLTVTETDHTLPASMPPYTTEWTETDRLWNITRGTGDTAVSTTRTRETSPLAGTYRIVTTVSKGGAAASVVAENYISLPVGELLLSRTEGYGSPDALTTTYAYDGAGSRISSTGPQQGETRTIHDAHGRATVLALPWAGGQNRIINTSYRSDGATWTDEPAQIDTTIVDAGGIPRLHLRETYAYSETNAVKRVEKRSTANGLTRLEITETWQGNAENIHARGRLRMTQTADGIQTWHDYAPASAHGALYTATEETRIGGQPVPGHSTRSTAWIDAQGNALRTEQHILDSAGHWQLLAAADYEHDIRNRWTKRTRSNGRTTTRAHICTGDLLRETDENGTTTTYGYDSSRQLIETVRSATATTPETVTSYQRDAQGRILRTRRDTGAMTTVETAAYDLQGRLIAQTDTLGRTTAYAYSADGLTETLTTPSGATLITERNPDGSLARQHGTGQRELLHEHDYSNARIRHTVKLADRSTILSQTLENGFGETVVVTTPSTTGYLYDRTTYNNKGQITQRQRDTGSAAGSLAMAPTLYEHDAFGNPAKETWKLAATPTLANSRITTWAYRVETRADGIYRIAVATKNNGKGTTCTETAAQLISEHPTLETRSEHTGPRGHTTVDSTAYGEGPERIVTQTLPTSAIEAAATVIDGYTVSQTDHAGITTTARRDWTATGLRLTQTDGRGNASVTLTDIAGRPVSTTDAAGHTTATEYCPCCDNPACITDALGHTARYAYDIRGRKTAEWGTGIQPARYAYDEADRLTALTTWRADEENIETDPTERTDGDTTTWQYHDATGLLTRKTYADATHEDTEYNALNMLAQKTDARGIVSTYTWDTAKGLCTRIEHSDATPAQQYTYNHIGNLYRIVDAQGTRDIVYNNYNEKDTDSVTVAGIKHTVTETYDAYGRPAGYTLTKPGSALDTVAWRYGTDGRLNQASFLQGTEEKTFAYAYLPGSHLLHTLAHPNGLLTTRSYEPQRDLPTAIDTTRGATGVVLRGYTYDPLGRPATRTRARQGTTRQDAFTYNDRSELTGATLGTTPYAYAYDNIGNRETAQEAAQSVTSYAANQLNQYTAIGQNAAEPFIPAYDADGNQTTLQTQTGKWTVDYNANNRPTRFTSQDGNTIVENGYDYMGRRYMKKVSVNGTVILHQHYLYRGYLQIAALDLTRSNAPALWLLHWDPTQPVATRPLSLRKNGTWYTYGHDLTKNVMELYKADGTIATAYDYTPYGSVTASGIDQPIQWSSEHYDPELALVYYNYRHYNPADGRWINRDPIGEREHLHLSIYVRNNPPMLYDLHGLETTDDEMAKALEEIRVKISGEDEIEIDCKGVESAKQAARNVIEKWNPVSIKDDVEYGGRVCACCVRKTKKYLYITTHVRGKNGEVEPEDAPPCPVGYKLAGIWHTHGKASSKDPYETFAPADIMKIHKLGVPGYLGTPSGAVRTLDPNKTTPPPAYNTPDPTKKTIV
ncbi:DUF4329 domain-containing protein [Akkermansia glycaniphila]|uniref:RHS repeat-associated core domain-containing protein n=1 Tax=Akkermansia glycaniphila TaxID=1679444 RepID=UPI001C01729D|nr:RHS repeat-associated core domain-containing protein [Akkermansia glycaniphila]MBT9450126.1 DUF4329 domain-containing protein [Akkermansia glycaniphila]